MTSLLMKLLALLASVTEFTQKVDFPSFELESSASINGTIPVSSYITRTGIRVIIAQMTGPMIKTYLCLATKTHDDNGTPHVLEHLVFMGSENYPYNGALGLIGNRMFSDGINAFTGVDRTCYVSHIAGKEGSLRILPIYLDHIFFPTLTKSAYKTEVHHINKDGLDGGVVYSEMQGTVYTSEMYFAMLKALYKGSGYDAYTGGKLKNLRETTTHKMAVDYHKEFYRPNNLCITICGDVNINEVMESIGKIEMKILTKFPQNQSKMFRPWLTPIPTLQSTTTKILIPSVDDGVPPQVYIGWRGPNCVTQYRTLLACSTMLAYLQANAIPQEFRGGSFCDVTENAQTGLYLGFTNVALNETNFVYPKLQKEFKKIAEGIIDINVNAIKDIIYEKMAKFLSDLEAVPFDTISKLTFNHFVYGRNDKEFQSLLNTLEEYEYLLTVPDRYWVNILKRYFIGKKHVQCIGVASTAELDRLNKEDSKRIEKRIQQLGPDGLKKKGDELAEAIALNAIPVPNSILKSVRKPNPSGIHFHDVKIYRTGDRNEAKPVELKIDSWPMYAEVYDCRTRFIYITATFFTHKIEISLRPYINLFLYLISYLSIDEKSVENTEMPLNDFLTVKTMTRIGISDPKNSFSCGSFSQTAIFMIQVEQSEYAIGVQYFIGKLQHTVFDVESIRNVINSLLNEVTESQKNFDISTLDLLKVMNYGSNTNVKVNSVMYQKSFLTSLLEGLKNDGESKKILADLNNLRAALLSNSNLAVHVTADLNKQKITKTDFNIDWQRFNFTRGVKKLHAISDWQIMTPANDERNQGEVLGLDSTDISTLYHTSPGINDYNHNDLPALYVAIAYISNVEGPMWRRIRGPGYTYDCILEVLPNEGKIWLFLYRATDVVSAFKEFVKIVNERIATNAVWDQTLVDGAKGVAIYRIAKLVPAIGDITTDSILLSFKNVPDSYHKNLIDKISAVTIDDIKRVARLYMTKILSPTETRTAIICNEEETDHISDGFKQLGFNLQVRQSWDDSALGRF